MVVLLFVAGGCLLFVAGGFLCSLVCHLNKQLGEQLASAAEDDYIALRSCRATNM